MAPRLLAAAFFGLVALTGACEVVFQPDDLARGTTGTGGAAGMAATSSGAGGCTRNDDCSDRDPCTADICDHGHCRNPKQANLVCADAVGCIPASRCDEKGRCPVATPDDASCDDGNPCTDEICLPSGKCANPPKVEGTKCFDGHACGTCDGTGQCGEVFLNAICQGDPHPPDQYIVDFECLPGCAGFDTQCNPYCVNGAKWTIACLPSFKACCALGPDCSAACPQGYTMVPNSQQSDPGCACGSTQAASVMCTQ